MLKLSEELEQLSACDDYSNGLYGLPERAAALEIELDALKAEVQRLTPLQFRPAPCYRFCESAAFKIEIKQLKAKIETAQKQEPAVLIEGKKIFWNPEYKGVHEGGFYASPVPAQKAGEVTQDIVEAAHEVTRALTALRHTRDAFEIGGLIRSDLNSICDVLDVTASKLFQMAKGGEND